MANYAHPLGNPKVRYLTTAGAVLNGGKLYSYAAGTTTAKTTWEDGAMQTANANPVILDSYGQASVYCQGRYKFVLKNSADVEQWTEDNVWFPTITDDAASLLDDTSASAMRTTLGLGTAAVEDVGTDAGDVVQLDSSGYYPAANGSLITNIASSAVTIPLPYGYLSGCTITRATGTTFSVSAGEARDSTDAYNASLSSAITKSLSSWAAGTGNGSLDTGSLAVSTWYHVFLVCESDGTTDVCISNEGSAAPTLTGLGDYDYYRRIGSIYLDTSKEITAFHQFGDSFLWDNPPIDIDIADLTTSEYTLTSTVLTVPLDVKVWAIVQATSSNGENACSTYLSSPDTASEEPAGDTTSPIGTIVVPNTGKRYSGGIMHIRTNTAAQIACRASQANTDLDLTTIGWRDDRGK